MTSHGMLVCSFFVKKRFEQTNDDSLYFLNDELNVSTESGKVTESFRDFFELLHVFCNVNKELSDDVEKQKLFSISEDTIRMYNRDTYRAMSFVVKSGNYGVEAEIIDRKTGEETHHRSADEAAVMKFNCVVYVPKDVGNARIFKGILIFETIGVYGAKTVTTKYLRTFFAQYGITFETRSVSIKVFMDKLIQQGNLYRITLINNKLSPNEADNMLIASGKETRSYLKPQLKPEFLENMLAWFERADKTGICEIPDSEVYDDIAVTFRINDRARTVRLGNIEKMSIIEDIPEQIFRTRDSNRELLSYMIETADTYKSKMVFSKE